MAWRTLFCLNHSPHGDIQKVLEGNLLARLSAEGVLIFHENGGLLVLEDPSSLPFPSVNYSCVESSRGRLPLTTTINLRLALMTLSLG